MKRTAANDATSMCGLAYHYYHGKLGLQQDLAMGVELFIRAARLGSSQAHYNLGNEYRRRGDLKKAKIHTVAAAMLGTEIARNNLGYTEAQSGNMERAVKHWTIAASGGNHVP
jgi:TPR repeat protein